MAGILPGLTAPGPELAWERLCSKASFRQGEKQMPSATFHPAHTTAAQPQRSSKALYFAFILLLPRIYSHRDPYALALQFPFIGSSSLFRRWRKTPGSRSTFGLKATDLWWSSEELVMCPGQQIIFYIWLDTQLPLLLLRALVQGWELRLSAAGAPLLPWGPPSTPIPVQRSLSPSLPTSAHPGQGHTFPRPCWPWSQPRTAMPWCPAPCGRRRLFIFSRKMKTVLSDCLQF